MLAHFQPVAALDEDAKEHRFVEASPVPEEIEAFLHRDRNGDLATDQLLNALHLLTLEQNSQNLWRSPDAAAADQLRSILYRELHARDGVDRDGIS